jgi:class 3 adenylate cyclase
VELLNKAKQHNSQSSDSSGLGGIYMNLAYAASLDGDINKTLEYDIKALTVFEKLKDFDMLGVAYNNIAIDYSTLGEYSEAASFAKKSIELSKKRGDIAAETEAHLNLGTIYYQMNKIQESFLEIQESIRLTSIVGSNVRLIEAYSNMAELLNHQKRYTEAEEYLKKSLAIAREFEDEYSILFGLSVLGDNALQQNKYTQAITYYQESNKFAERDSSLETLEKNYQGLAKAHVAMNNYLKAYEYEKKLKDLIVAKGGKEKSEQLARMRTEFETERKQHQIEVLSKDTLIQQKEINRQKLIRNAVIAGLTVVLLFLIVVIFQKRRITIEKARSEELLLNILPYETAQELKEKGSANAKLFEEVTVLFTDFKGFTQVAEQLSPQELVAEIHYCFKAFDLIMERYRIEKIKTIGDAYMAAAGLPVENKSNPEAVVSAALEIQQFINQYSIERKQAGKHAFEIRIGIHTGPVVAGIVGIKKFQYDIWGDTVNIASRMESSGEAGQINISQSTYTLVKEHFICVHRGKIEAKNKGQIDMYFVMGKHSLDNKRSEV